MHNVCINTHTTYRTHFRVKLDAIIRWLGETAKDKCTPLEFSITTCLTRGYAFRIQHYDGCLIID
jgi:hypothetical protein